jgi:fermentation-respiration switch protein FrsA (DUF1100 family)
MISRGRIQAFVAWVLLFLFSFSFFGCSSVFYQPDSNLYFLPKRFNLAAQEYSFPSRDGTQLVAWFLQAQTQRGEKPLGTIVQFHGNAENMSSHYLSLAWLIPEGYNLFTFDYRGYGKSKGKPDQAGVYMDALAALDEARSLHEKSGAKRFVVYGQSLGGVISMRALLDYKAPVDLVVMDSTFASYEDEAQSFLASYWFTWIFSPLGRLLVSDKYSAEEAVIKNQRPLLVIHDHHDPVVPFEHGKWIFDHANSKKDFWELDQGHHVGIFIKENEDWREKFVKYLRAL